jgi:metal-sulfur cluster biosynthetic enzyme
MGRATGTELFEQVVQITEEIIDPCSRIAGVGLSIADMGLVRDLRVSDDGCVAMTLAVTSPCCQVGPIFQHELNARITALPGVGKVAIELTVDFDWSEARVSDTGRSRLEGARERRRVAGALRVHGRRLGGPGESKSADRVEQQRDAVT